MPVFGTTPDPNTPTNPNDYYQNVNYGNYQPYTVAGTPFGAPTGAYPTTTNVEPNSGQPPGTTTPQQTPSPTAGGLFNAPNWLYQPQDAVFRAMRMQGMNPASFSPVTQQILQNSGNLVSTLFGQMAGQGGDASAQPNIMDNNAMLGRLGQLIGQAAAGGRVFGGTSPSTLANFSQAQAASQAGTATDSQNIIADYLSDPTRAMNITRSLLYSGYAPQFQRAAAAPMANLADYYQRLLEQGQDYGRSIIDVLLGAPVYGHPAGSVGVPLPFQASAWRYAPGGTPGLQPTTNPTA